MQCRPPTSSWQPRGPPVPTATAAARSRLALQRTQGAFPTSTRSHTGQAAAGLHNSTAPYTHTVRQQQSSRRGSTSSTQAWRDGDGRANRTSLDTELRQQPICSCCFHTSMRQLPHCPACNRARLQRCTVAPQLAAAATASWQGPHCSAPSWSPHAALAAHCWTRYSAIAAANMAAAAPTPATAAPHCAMLPTAAQ